MGIILFVLFVVFVVILWNAVGLDCKCTDRCAMYPVHKFNSIEGRLLVVDVLQWWPDCLYQFSLLVQIVVLVVRVLLSEADPSSWVS
jgi:hypothetical protein